MFYDKFQKLLNNFNIKLSINLESFVKNIIECYNLNSESNKYDNTMELYSTMSGTKRNNIKKYLKGDKDDVYEGIIIDNNNIPLIMCTFRISKDNNTYSGNIGICRLLIGELYNNLIKKNNEYKSLSMTLHSCIARYCKLQNNNYKGWIVAPIHSMEQILQKYNNLNYDKFENEYEFIKQTSLKDDHVNGVIITPPIYYIKYNKELENLSSNFQ